MVAQIQLGNFFAANGRTVLGGVSGSGLDTEALIKALTDAKGLPALRLKDQITLNGKKKAALSEFQTLLAQFKSAVDALRNPPGVGNASSNAFKFTVASVASNTAIAGSTYLSITAAPGATLQTYAIDEIESLAAAKKQSTGDISIATAESSAVSATPSGGQFTAGTFTLRGESITLAAGDSLNAVAAKFNAVSDETGIGASIIKVADGTFRLSFVATESGLDNDFDLNDIYDPGTNPDGILDDPDGVFSSVTIDDTQPASDAVFTIDDVEIRRSTNSIDDVISGVTFNLLQVTPALTTLTATIGADTQTIQGSIVNFANIYNDIRTFFAKQTELAGDGTFAETALLADNQSFRTAVTAITSHISSIVNGITGGDPSRLSELGISFTSIPANADSPQVTNIINIDDGKLASAIATNLDGVRRVFEFDFVADNPNLRIFSRTNALAISEFTLNIDPEDGTYEATYDNGSGPVTISLDSQSVDGGITLRGQAGTVLEGMVMVYASTTASVIEVTATQGIADKLYNTSAAVLTPDTGALALEQNALKTSDERLTAAIDKIDEQVDKFREQLLAKFGALEAALSRINVLLQSLTAQADARNNA